MKNKQLKTSTYVDNPPVKDNITKTSFQMTFSKSNFVFIGKWIIAFVLVVVLGSQALNGFISSKFTKDSTTQTIVHEYKKEIGTELVGGNFNDFTFENFGQLTFNKKIYFKKQIPNVDFVSIVPSYRGGNGYFGLIFNPRNFKLYDDNNNLLYSRAYELKFEIGFEYYISGYSSNFDYLCFYIYDHNALDIPVYYCDIIGNYFSQYNMRVTYPTASYFTYDAFYPSSYSIRDFKSADDRVVLNEGYFNKILNETLVYESFEEVPIYETTTYTYEVKDNNYNWDLKLKQLSAFKPLFKFNQSFVNEEYLKYNNLISYDYINTSTGQQEIINRYKEDEKLKPLFDNNYLIIGGKTESGLFKDKTKFYSFLKFNGNLDFDIEGISSAYNWVLDNYVTDYNIDSYLNESKYKIELKDLLEIFKFPIQIVTNLVYDFGVLIGFITWW